MNDVARILLTNAATATALAAALTVLARWIRRPSIVHALWLVVLADLLMPPILPWGVVPKPWIVSALDSQPARGLVNVEAPAPAASEPILQAREIGRTAGMPGLGSIAEGLWIAGGILVLGLVWTRSRRFRTMLLRAGEPAPEAVQARARVLAEHLGLRRAPLIRLVNARIPPLLLPRLGTLEIVFPAELLAQLDDRERDTLFVHELAHARRGDPWARAVEQAATCLFWWHPLVFWARRSMRRAEEASCDAWVLRTLPGHARDYAAGLVKTLEHLAGADERIPALASGASDFRSLKERLTMILSERTPRRLSRTQVALIAGAALAVLLVFPTWAEREGDGPARSVRLAGVEAGVEGGVEGGVAGGIEGGVEGGIEGGTANALLHLQREAELLEREMRALEERRGHLEHRMAEIQHGALTSRAPNPQEELARQQVHGHLAQQLELERRRVELELARAADDMRPALGHMRQGLARQRAVLESQGRAAEAEEVQRRMGELDIAMDHAGPRGHKQTLELEVRALGDAVRALVGMGEEQRAHEQRLQRAIEELDRQIQELRGSDPL